MPKEWTDVVTKQSCAFRVQHNKIHRVIDPAASDVRLASTTAALLGLVDVGLDLESVLTLLGLRHYRQDLGARLLHTQ